jgi:NAD(P)-dependent dehydrogenase (short-subunit alcohol dehydrogenase family)
MATEPPAAPTARAPAGPPSLAGRVALVAGGARNIGRAVALAFAHAGAEVAVAARTPSQIDEAVALLRQTGRRATGIACDLRQPEDAFALADAVERDLGPIDILVNAVGGSAAAMPVLLPEDGSRPDVALWHDILELNLLTVVHACAAVAPKMAARRRGAIVNFGGGSGASSDPRHAPPGVRPFSPYSTAKAAVLRFSELLAWELAGRGVRVNTMGPGLVPARQPKRDVRGDWLPLPTGTPAARARGPEDAARLALFLASDQSAGLTGRHLDVGTDWESLVGRIDGLMATDRFMLKRTTEPPPKEQP